MQRRQDVSVIGAQAEGGRAISMATLETNQELLDLAREGARNLVEEAAGVERGDHVLILNEYGRVDRELEELIGEAVTKSGGRYHAVWSEPISPDDMSEPKILVSAMRSADRVIYSTPAGAAGQRMVSPLVAFLDKDEGPFRITNNFCTVELLASDYARFSARTVRALYDHYEKLFFSGKTWRITTPAGTDISADIGTVSSRQAVLEGQKSPYSEVFPPRVHCPVGSVNANGIIAVEHCALPPVKIQHPVMVAIKDDRVVSVEGGPEADDYARALEENAKRWGDQANFLDSWHGGLNPYGPNITGFLGHGCAARMHLHLGRSDTYTSAGILHHTIEVDGKVVLEDGNVVLLDDPEFRRAVGL